MKRLSPLVQCVFLVSLMLSLSTISAQTAVTPELIQQYQSTIGANPSPEQVQQAINDYQKQNSAGGSKAVDHNGADNADNKNSDSDPKEKTDDVAKTALSGEKNTGLSLYEMLLRGINLYPDDLLRNLQLYGYDVFSNTKPSTFSPSNSFSVPADYPINTDDELIIFLWGRLNQELRLKVTRDGTINLPYNIGPVSVAGLPFAMVQKNILDRINKIEGVQGTVSMGTLRSVGIYIVGEVVAPGFYTVSALTNVTNALFSAGGPTKRGSLRNIQLKRGGTTVATIDFYDFLLAGIDRSGLRLQPGDVIHVPIVKNVAAIAGNVRRSALYELKGKTTLADLIKLAGGLSPTAWSNRIQVERYSNNQFQVVLDIDSTTQGLPKFELEDGDIVKIFPVLIKDKNAVYLSGNVMRPGKYEYKPGMRISDVIPGYQSLFPETYFDYGIIMRIDAPSFLAKIIPFCLKKALDDPASADNLPLQPKDEIVIYNRDYFEPDRSVSISGAVNKPGTMKLLENMKLRDLVLQAGGLRDDASPTRGELYRRKMVASDVQTAKIDFCVECAMKDDPASNLVLERSDRVFVRQKMGWENERKVTLSGEFVYPGTYVIFEGERLGDLIKRAGGFKPGAYLSASVFTRKSVKTFRIIIDITNPNAYESFSLEDGDVLSVPRDLNTVSVIGEVYNPATFVFKSENSSVKYYIESAGGLNDSGDRKHTYVIKADGRIITNRMKRIPSLALEPGDVVVVPKKGEKISARQIFAETVDAIFKIASATAIVLSIFLILK